METRDRILEASARLLGARGYSGSGLKEIAGSSQAPFGSIYHHFPGGKEEIAEESIRRQGRFYLDLLLASLDDGGGDLASAVRATFTAAGEVLVATGYRDACPVATVALEVASSNERLRRATAEVFAGWVEALAGHLTARGVPAAGATALAMVLVELLEGAFLLCRAQRSTVPMAAAADAAAVLVAAAGPAHRPAER